MKSWEHDTTVNAVNALAKDINDWAKGKGFWERFTIPNEHTLVKTTKIMLVVTELAELVEGLRKAEPGSVGGFSNEEEEVADTIIRLLDYSGAYGLRVGEAIAAKMEKNVGRPFRHGKQF